MTDTPEAIDIHQTERRLTHALAALHADTRILPEQRTALVRFINDARLGRTVKRGAHRRLGPGRCAKLLAMLVRFGIAIRCPFHAVTQEQMEQFVLGLESGSVTKLIPSARGVRYSASTVQDTKKALRKFYRWVLADQPARFEELTSWFDTREILPELRTFGLPEVERLADGMGTVQGRAIVWTFFDGGFRAGELFNVRLQDLWFQRDADGQDTAMIRIRVSKTKPRTVSLPIATPFLTRWVLQHPDAGAIEPTGAVRAHDPTVLLFQYHYGSVRRLLRAVGKAELGRVITPHDFRRSSATFYARRLGHYQLTARFGWSMASRVVQRYVDHSGILAEDVAMQIRRSLPVKPRLDARVDALLPPGDRSTGSDGDPGDRRAA